MEGLEKQSNGIVIVPLASLLLLLLLLIRLLLLLLLLLPTTAITVPLTLRATGDSDDADRMSSILATTCAHPHTKHTKQVRSRITK